MRKPITSFVMFVRPSVRMEQLASHWTDFHEILYLRFFENLFEKIQVSLKLDMTTNIHFWSYLAQFFL